MSQRPVATGSSRPSLKRTVSPRARGNRSPQCRDIVVVGASTGGVEALKFLCGQLPANLSAAVFVVLHVPACPASRLPEILAGAGKLPARHAVHGEKIAPGNIYVAPPDNHMMLEHGYLRVIRGPRENGHRPAIDPLFRSAARHYGGRVIGVILTGARDCGSAGLLTIKAFGGVAIVQEPAEAICADMPRNALRYVNADHVLPLARIPAMLVRELQKPAVAATDSAHDIEAAQVAQARPAGVVCPECGGSMIESETQGLLHFRCHTGHAFSIEGLLADQGNAVESALWAAQRALEESEDLARRMAQRSARELSRAFEERADAMRQYAQTIKDILLQRPAITRAAAATQGKKAKRSK